MSKKKSNPLPPLIGHRPPPPPPPPAAPHKGSLADNHKEIVVDSLTTNHTAEDVENMLDVMLGEYTLEQTLATEILECMKGEEYSKEYRRLESKKLRLIAGFNALYDLRSRLINAEIL